MSKIRLHGSSSGYTEIAPVAASGNNTLTLPNDGTIISQDSNGAVGVTSITVGTGVTIGDGRVTCTTLHGSAANCTQIPAANIVGVCTAGFERTGGFGGITMVDTWDLSSTIGMGNDTETTITTQWSRANDFNGVIGSAMTVDSSGIFTFPSTGIYRITFHLSLYNNHNSVGRYAFARIKATTNNSAYATRSQAGGNSVQNSGYVYQTMRTDYIMDVTDTSTHKLYFTAVHDAPSTINGDASADSNLHTYVMFMRLGDT